MALYDVLLLLLLLPSYLLLTDGAPQARDLRTCGNIHCLRDEVCVMEMGDCDFKGQCKHYPTCRLPRTSPIKSCEHYRCPPGQFCTLLEDRCLRPPCPSGPACVSSNVTGSCEHYKCPPGQFCVLLEDRCFRPPCPSGPTCVSSSDTGFRRVRKDVHRP